LATDQEVLGSTPSRRTRKVTMKISLQNSVIYFFIIIGLILLLITLLI